MGSQIGKQAGRSPRRSGAVGFTAKAARTREVVAPRLPLLSRTIATQDLPIGWRAGQFRRKHGAVRTRARDALQRQEGVPERERAHRAVVTMALAREPSSGAIGTTCPSVALLA